jgi:hypothetical protein
MLAELEVLEWLWETGAKPVLDVLQYTEVPPNDFWPRIWWIPTGPLTKFPIHAAGCHRHGSSDAVVDRVISSYSSSVKTLIHGRQRYPKVRAEQGTEKVVLIGMQELVHVS